jgi:S-adenosylmethionine:tRNA ribosyltransferase-isomerase
VRVADFYFDLPQERIAQHPPAERGTSRMLTFDRATGHVEDHWFRELPECLEPGDLLVLNDSRVLPARLYATRAGLHTQTGSPPPSGRIEVLLIERAAVVSMASPDPTTSAVPSAASNARATALPSETMTALPQEENLWRALVRPAKKVPVGEILSFAEPDALAKEAALIAEVVAKGEHGERTLRFTQAADAAFFQALERIGHMPLPPYIRRAADEPDSAEDRSRYQTIYARPTELEPPGSAAAPTAGLHFTPEILDRLRARGVEVATVTLHVGLGTFQPVRVDRLDEIRLHAERYTLSPETAAALNRARREGRRIIAAGTTTTRTLEHCALVAERAAAAQSNAAWQLQPHSGATSIFLAPGHRFRVVSGLLTNFHLPESTLLILVAAFASTDPENAYAQRARLLAAYAHAVSSAYRFFSYGDCMLLL